MYNQIDSNKRKTFFLILFFIFFITGLGWVFSYFFDTGYTPLFIAFLFSIIAALFSYFQGDAVALWSTGAKQITLEDAPQIYRLVENLSMSAGLPMPKVYIIQDPAPNAFATGRNPKHASVALTTGLIERLNKTELEGVIAHELAHIKNYDILVMTIVIVLVGTVAMLSDFFLRTAMFSHTDRNDRNSGTFGAVLLVVGLAFMILAPFIAKLIQLAVSRKREYLADATGALLTRYPEGLASALEKISSYTHPMKKASNATAHLFIANPFFGAKKFTALFSTHPPIDDRIHRLRKML